MNTKNTSSGCNGLQQGSNCVIWSGQNIPALGISKGDNITQALCAIATSIAEIAAPLDVSNVSLQCLKDQLDVEEPLERSIATMLQIAYDSECTLKTLIDKIAAKLDATSTNTLTLNLGCLASFDQYGNPLPYDEQSVLQLLLNTACSQKSTIASLSGDITEINQEIADLQAVPVYKEPVLNSCLFSGKTTSDAVVLTASALCGYQEIIGQQTDVQGAMSQVPTNFSTLYGQIPNWIINPDNLAQSYSNLVIAFANLVNRVTTIENTCCAASCDKVVVDFDIKLSDDRTQATLFFITKSSVPAGFTEPDPRGSKLIVTDGDGNVFTTYIKVVPQLTNPDGVVIDLNASSIDPSTDYTFGMNVTLVNGSLTCVKCISHTATFKDTCSFCQITVTGTPNSADKIVLIYTTPTSTTPQYSSIQAGQTQVIPKSSIVSSILAYGNASYTSTCGALPNPSQTSCYEFSYGMSKTVGGAEAVMSDAVLQSISVLGTAYPVGVGIDGPGLTTAINNLYPVSIGLIANPLVVYGSSISSAQIFAFKIYFQTTAVIAATMEGYLAGPGASGLGDGFDSGAYIKPLAVASSNCPALTTNPVL